MIHGFFWGLIVGCLGVILVLRNATKHLQAWPTKCQSECEKAYARGVRAALANPALARAWLAKLK